MTIAERILENRPRAAGQLLALAGRAAAAARRRAARAAAAADAAREPLATLAGALRELNGLSARYAGRMLEQNASTAQAALADGARRLRQLARAPDLVSAWQEQQQSLPALRNRLVTELQATMSIVADGGRELADLARDTYGQLAPPAKPAAKRRAEARRAPRRPAKKKAGPKGRAST